MSGRPNWGKVIDPATGRLRYVSASSLQKADHSTSTGCMRRWLYDYRFGIKEPPTPALERGNQVHEEIERYYLTGGDRAQLGPMTLPALPIMPDPGPDLAIEHSMVPLNLDGVEDVALAPLRPGGVPMVGKIDLLHARGTNKGATSIEETVDRPGTVEVLDWKTTARISYAKRPEELPDLIQMASYARYVFEVVPSCEQVRLSHGYIPVSGLVKKVSTLVDRTRIDRTWKRVEALAGSLVDAARETDPDRVPANTRACNAFNRPCPAFSACKAPMQHALSTFLGPTAAEALLGKQPEVTQANPNSITARLEAARAAQAGTAAPAADEAVEAAKRKMAAEEVRAQYPWLEKCLDDIRACGVGFPTLTGFAAGAVGRLTGATPSAFTNDANQVDHRLDGEGTLSGYTIADVEKLPGALEEIRQFVAASNARVHEPAATTGSLAHQAEMAGMAALAAREAGAIADNAFLPPDAPPSDPAGAAVARQDAAPADGETKKKPGRPKGSGKKKKDEPSPFEGVLAPTEVTPIAEPAADAATAVTTVVATYPTAAVANNPSTLGESVWVGKTAPTAQVLAEVAGTAIHLYENCATSFQCEPLEPLVWRLKNELAKQANLKDPRLAGTDSPLGYGKAMPALQVFIRETGLAGGRYSIYTRGSDLMSSAAEVLREMAIASGGSVTRGE